MPRTNPILPIMHDDRSTSACTSPLGSRLAPQQPRNAILSQLGKEPGSAMVHMVVALGHVCNESRSNWPSAPTRSEAGPHH